MTNRNNNTVDAAYELFVYPFIFALIVGFICLPFYSIKGCEQPKNKIKPIKLPTAEKVGEYSGKTVKKLGTSFIKGLFKKDEAK